LLLFFQSYYALSHWRSFHRTFSRVFRLSAKHISWIVSRDHRHTGRALCHWTRPRSD
jgi:hypothetical protein